MIVRWDEKALKELQNLDSSIQKRIIKSAEELAINPKAKDIKRLKGISGFRLRIGDYRVIFQMFGDVIFISKVGHRRNIYKRLLFQHMEP